MLDLKLDGIGDAIAAIGLVASQLNSDEARQAAAEWALEPVRDTAKGLVSVRSGALRDDIGIKTEDGVTFVGPLTGAGFHGWFLEFGATHMAASPFMGPAWEANVDVVFARLGEAIASQIELALGRHSTGSFTRAETRFASSRGGGGEEG